MTAQEAFARLHGSVLLLADALLEAAYVYRIAAWLRGLDP